jgi:hypothetical protein
VTSSILAVLPARFDWYATTITERPQRLIQVLCARLHGVAVECKPQNGYGEAVQILSGKRVLATVYHGGKFAWPHAFASSDETDAFVAVVRDVWPDDHSVTRMDCALDYDDGPGTFDSLLKLCTDLADGKRVDGDNRKRAGKIRVRNVGDWTFKRDGRTLYLGSTKSAVMIRLYEKGIQLRQQAELYGVPRDDISLDLVRLEVQVRPDKGAKRIAARAEPRGAFGYSEWTRELLRRLDGVDVERVHIRERRLSDHERAFRWMVKQYRQHIIEEALDAGGWDELGKRLHARIMEGEHGEMPTDDREPFVGPFREEWGTTNYRYGDFGDDSGPF